MVTSDSQPGTRQSAQSAFYFDRDTSRAESITAELSAGGYRVEMLTSLDDPVPSMLELAEHEAVVLEAQGDAIYVAQRIVEVLMGPHDEPVVPVVLLVDRDNTVPFPGAESLPALRAPFSPSSLLRLLDLQLEWTEDNQKTTLYEPTQGETAEQETVGVASGDDAAADPLLAELSPVEVASSRRRLSAYVLGASLLSLVAVGAIALSSSRSDEATSIEPANTATMAQRR